MNRKFIFISFGLLLLGILAYFYINNVFFPVNLKEFLIKKAEEMTGCDVSLGAVRFEPIKGFVLEGIEIAEKNNPKEDFLEIDEINFNIVFTSVLKEKSIIIPKIIIKSPVVKLERLNATTWNFSDLIKQPTPSATKNKYQVFLRKIVIQDAKIGYLDHTDPEIFEETFSKTNAEAVLNLNKTIQFKLETSPSNAGASIKAEGIYDISKKNVQGKIAARNLFPHKYAPLYLQGQAFSLINANLSSLELNIQADIAPLKIAGTGQIIISDPAVSFDQNVLKAANMIGDKIIFLIQQNSLQTSGSLTVNGLNAALGEGKNLSGDLLINLDKVSFLDGKLFGEGNVKLSNASFENTDQWFKGQVSSDKLLISAIDGELTLNGNLLAQDADIHIKANQYLKAKTASFNNFKLTKKDAQTILETQMQITDAFTQISDGQTLTGQISSKQTSVLLNASVLDLYSQIAMTDAVINSAPNIVIKGNPVISVSVKSDLTDPSTLSYSAEIQADQTLIQGVPEVKDVTIKTGKLKIAPNSVSTDNMVIETLGILSTISGSVSDFSNLFINGQIVANSVDIAKITPFIPADLRNNWQLTGTSDIDLKIKGPAKGLNLSNIQCSANLANAQLTGKSLPEAIDTINGRIDVVDNLIAWNDLSGRFQGNTFILNGKVTVPAPKTPSILDLKIDSAKENPLQISVNSQMRILNNAFQILLLTGSYYQSTFDLKGDVRLPPGEEPNLDIRGLLTLNLEDLKSIPALKDKLAALNPKGVLAGEGLFKGSPQNWKDWQISLAATSSRIYLADHPLENIDFKITQRDQNISKFDLKADIYNGLLTSSSQVDLRDPQLNFMTETRLDNMDLSLLRSQKSVKEKQISGALSAQVSAEGPLSDQALITGKGSFTIINGYLGRIIPQFEEAYFTDAAGSFIIKDKKIITDDTLVTSKTILLNAEGYIDFSQNIEFEIRPKLSEIMLAQEDSLRIDPMHLLSRAVNIKVSGTLAKPHYAVVTSPIKVIGNTTDIIREGVGEILKDLF